MTLRELNDPEYLQALAAATSDPGDPAGVAPAWSGTDPLEGFRTEDLILKERERDPLHRLVPYLRQEILPTTFCVGCGGGTVLNTFANAVEEMKLDPKEMVCVTGIGCSSWIPSPYFLVDTLHTTHGRAVAFASGVKVMKPDMKVILIAGDGDLAGIGGNHLIHAARRNLDLTVFLVNNFIYGMTGGQVSPTTPFGTRTTTTPYKNVEHPFKIADLVVAAGGNYVARWTTYHVFQLMESMQRAIRKKGFSFVEIMSQCPVSYGKMVGMRDAVSIVKHLRDRSIHVDDARGMSEEELEDRIVVGKLIERNRSEFTDGLQQLNAERRAALRQELGGCAVRIRFSGFGGQGVILCGLAFGKAAMFDGKNAVQTQTYGSASRGGLTKSDVCIEDGEIYDLLHDELDVLVTLSQQSYDKYRPHLLPGGTLFYESDLVTVDEKPDTKAYGIPATDVAFKEFGRKIMANMVMMGCVHEIVGVVSQESLERTIRESVPAGTEEKNIQALARGGALGAEQR